MSGEGVAMASAGLAGDFAELSAAPRGNAGITASRRDELRAALRAKLGASKDARTSARGGGGGTGRVAQLMQSMSKWGAEATFAQAGLTAEKLHSVASSGKMGGGKSARALSRATGVSAADVGGMLSGAAKRRSEKRAARRAAARAEVSDEFQEAPLTPRRAAARNVPVPSVSFDDSLAD